MPRAGVSASAAEQHAVADVIRAISLRRRYPQMEEYEILGIYRELRQGGGHDFKMLLFDGKDMAFKKASGRMETALKRGRFYKQDWICVREGEDGIVFESVAQRPYSYVFVFGREYESEVHSMIKKDDGHVQVRKPGDPDNGTGVLLPFLNDTLPYSTLEMNTVSGRPVYNKQRLFTDKFLADQQEYVTTDFWLSKPYLANLPMIGRVAYKTRMGSISYNRRHPYYFLILLTSPRSFVKAIVWGEDLPYSSMRIGDVLGLSIYRKREPIEVGVVEYNRFTEAAYFRCREISVKEMFKVELEKSAEMPASIFDEVCGEIEYMSVLNRRCTGALEEYHLLRVGGAMVLVFYNSSKEFYEMEVGKTARIMNLRTMRRGDVSFYISTIYTQIEFLDKAAESAAGGAGDTAVNFEDGSSDCGDAEDSMITIQQSLVFGAVGYVPDWFSTEEEMHVKKQEEIDGAMYDISPFMIPSKISLRDMHGEVDRMVLNESRKFLVKAVLVDVDFSNFVFNEASMLADGTVVSYFRNGVQMQQSPAYVRINDGEDLTVCLFNNVWADGWNVDAMYRVAGCSSLDELRSMRGREMRFIVDAFRASEDIVLYYLTRMFGRN